MIKKIYENEQEIGWLEYTLAGDEIQIIDIHIKEAYRRKGHAIKTLQDFIAGTTGYSYVILEVRQSNFPALELYKKLGFQTLDIRKNYYNEPKEDALVMKLKLR